MKLIALAFALVLAACGDETESEPQPTFTCSPQPATARGCGPMTAYGYTAGEPGMKYPVGCTVFFPFDHPFYPGTSYSCTCEELSPGGEPVWGCPG